MQQRYVLFQCLRGSMLLQHVPHFTTLNFLVPEERIHEICGAADYAAWERIGLESHGTTVQERDASVAALDRAVDAMTQAPWVLKSTGQSCAAPDGSAIVRVLTRVPSLM